MYFVSGRKQKQIRQQRKRRWGRWTGEASWGGGGGDGQNSRGAQYLNLACSLFTCDKCKVANTNQLFHEIILKHMLSQEHWYIALSIHITKELAGR